MLAVHCLKMKQAISPFIYQKRMKSVFSRSVNFFFKKNLLLTNCVSSGGFMAAADLIIQEMEYRAKSIPERYDWLRIKHMFIVGCLMGPLHHYYYLYLDKLLPKASLKTVFIKIAADQSIASPATIIFFFFGMATLEGKTYKEMSSELVRKFKYVYLGDCMFWPPVQFINFYYLPTQYRVFYINFATMIFDVFLSFMKHVHS